MEKTLVIIKPDGVARNLIGEIILRFERAGLKVIGIKMVKPDLEVLEKHYNNKDDYLISLGNKTLKTYEDYKMDVKKDIGTDSALELGKLIRKWTIDYVGSGPVVPIVLQGLHAVDKARALGGSTLPINALPGTIRGDFSSDSPAYANPEKRGVQNVLHLSGTPEEAEFEIGLWFKNGELN